MNRVRPKIRVRHANLMVLPSPIIIDEPVVTVARCVVSAKGRECFAEPIIKGFPTLFPG
jgi:hypothetical protein